MTFLRSLSKKKGAAYSFFSAMTRAVFPASVIALLHLTLSVALPLTEFITQNTAAKEDISGNTPTADKLTDFLIYGTGGLLDSSLIYFLLAFLGFMSILTAVKIFSFICDKRTVNVYYSLGIKRSVLFISDYLGGALCLALAAAVPFTLSYIVNLIFLGASVPLSLSLLHLFTGFFIFSLICYSITAAVFSSVGTVAEAEIFSVAVIFAPTVLVFVTEQIITAFLPSAAYDLYISHFSDSSYRYSFLSLTEQTQNFNPLLFFTDDIELYSRGVLFGENTVMLDNGRLAWENPETYRLLPWFALCLAAFLAGLFLFRRIKAENCGFLDTNKPLSNIVTFGMCLTGASLLLGEMRWEPPVLILSLGALIALLAYIVAEIFLKRNLKKILKTSYKFAVHTVVIAIIFGIFATGAFGFDTYIPDRSKVVSAEISVPFSYSAISTRNIGYGYSTDMFIRLYEGYEYRFLPEITDKEDIDELMDIHRFINENDTDDGFRSSIVIRYNYADGNSCTRQITVTGREEIERLFSVFDMSSYKNELKNLFFKENRLEEIYKEAENGYYVDDALISALCFEYEFSEVTLISDSLNEHSQIKLSEDEFNALKEAVCTDLCEMTAKEYFTGSAKQLGVLSFAANHKAYELENINGYQSALLPDDTIQVINPDKTVDTEDETAPEEVGEEDNEDNGSDRLSLDRVSSVSEYPYEGLGGLSYSGPYSIVVTENMENTVSLLNSLGLLSLLSSEYEAESVILREFSTKDILYYYSGSNNSNYMLEFFAYSFTENDYYAPESLPGTDGYITVTDTDTVRAIEENVLLHSYTFDSGYFCLIRYKNGSVCVKYLPEDSLPQETASVR